MERENRCVDNTLKPDITTARVAAVVLAPLTDLLPSVFCYSPLILGGMGNNPADPPDI